METSFAVVFAAVFLFASIFQAKVLLRACALLRSNTDMRLPLNYVLSAIGVLTMVIAVGLALVFGVIALNN